MIAFFVGLVSTGLLTANSCTQVLDLSKIIAYKFSIRSLRDRKDILLIFEQYTYILCQIMDNKQYVQKKKWDSLSGNDGEASKGQNTRIVENIGIGLETGVLAPGSHIKTDGL